MKTVLLIALGTISLVLGVLFALYALYLHKKPGSAKRILSSVQVFTIGVFASVVLVFLPIYYTSYDFKDTYTYLRPLLISIHNAFRIFILDGDFDVIVDAIADQDLWLRLGFSFYAALLYVIAPILTFSNVLVLFKNIKDEIRYRWSRKDKYYIMSELNEKSIALAESICKKQENSVIVFTDVFEQNEESGYELLMKARDINAICLKKDISHLDFVSKKGDIEIFLIGNNESENISQAVKITTDLNQKNSKHNVKVFVFSTKPSAAYIIDSIKYDNLLQHAGKYDYGENCFKLRRIDEKQRLIWNTVPKMKLFEIAQSNENTLSVMIVGFGSYGIEFFKTLVWYCQFEGYKLQINIVDKRGKTREEKQYLKSMIQRDCPELLKKNRCETVGEAQYDIEWFPGVDVESSDLDELLLYDGDDAQTIAAAGRLKATNLAFVSLGDDDLNIETAIHLRSLFDRVNGVEAVKDFGWKDEAVDIYSVVYDDQKSKILYSENSADKEKHLLLNHKDVPYHIYFIGGMSSQFDYRNIYDETLEKSAYQHHCSWVQIEEAIYNEWLAAGDDANIQKHEWYFADGKTQAAAAKARKKYEQYEYYRLSSMAKELYQREVRNNAALLAASTCSQKEKKQTCKCDNCVRRKRSEHMRWNAYTRVLGYTYNTERADRALLHDNLCEWGLLSELDRQKD